MGKDQWKSGFVFLNFFSFFFKNCGDFSGGRMADSLPRSQCRETGFYP